jgi:hypothetical protein
MAALNSCATSPYIGKNSTFTYGLSRWAEKMNHNNQDLIGSVQNIKDQVIGFIGSKSQDGLQYVNMKARSIFHMPGD